MLALLLASAGALAQDYGETVRLKIETTAGPRKGALFLPAGAKKNEVFPLVVAIPGDEHAKAYVELGPWQQPAYDKRFAVFSVDCVTATQKGWIPTEQVEMRSDIEAVMNGIEMCRETARERGLLLDDTATVLTGWSGGSYLTMWMGVRRSDLFLGLCLRAPLWFPETVKFSKHDKIEIDPNVRIYLYRGENDMSRSKKETEAARKALLETGFRHVKTEIIPEMGHQTNIVPFLGWFEAVLKETGKSRKEGRRIAAEVARLRDQIAQGKTGAYSKLAKLAEREKKVGANGGAQALLAEVGAAASKKVAEADELAKAEQFAEAVALYKQVEKTYTGLPASRDARSKRTKLRKSGAYKAAEMLTKAKEHLEKDRKEKAFDLLEKIVERYPESGAAAEAQALLKG